MNKLEVENKLPDGWVKVRLESLGKTYTGLSGKNKEDFGEGKPYIPYMNIYSNRKIDLHKLEYVKIKRKEKQNTVKYGDIFFTTSSETPDEVGIISVLLKRTFQDIYLNSFCFGFRLNNFNNLMPEFGSFYLRGCDFRKSILKLAQGSTRYNLSKNNLLKIEITLPISLTEQQKIADILETVDETIEKTGAIIEKYKRIKQGLMQDLLTRGVTAFEFEKDELITAVKKVFDNGDHRFGREENLVNHLSRHLSELFLGWNVDSEVEKNNKRQRPDIIIHKRKMDENLFAIEVKKDENLNAIKQDIEKLEDVMLGDYNYEDAIFIGFDIENFEDVFKLSEKVNFILVSKNGKIKVRSHIRRFKDSPLGRIPEEWKIVKLSNITDVMVGYVGPISEFYITNGDKIPLLSTTNVSKNGIKLESLKYVTSKFHNRNKKSQIFPCDIMIARHGLSGSAAVIPDNLKEAQCLNVIIVRHSEKYESKFIEYLFNFKFIRDILIGWKSGSVQGVVNTKILEKFKIFLPPLLEQHRIAGILSQIDETIGKEQKYKQKLEQIKQGLMEDLLTGKVKVLNVN